MFIQLWGYVICVEFRNHIVELRLTRLKGPCPCLTPQKTLHRGLSEAFLEAILVTLTKEFTWRLLFVHKMLATVLGNSLVCMKFFLLFQPQYPNICDVFVVKTRSV